MSHEPQHPIALLVGLDQGEMVIPCSDPPQPDWLIARPVKLSVTPTPDQTGALANHRRFVLSAMRSPSHRWMRVYNEGRSMTPESAFVYFEVATEPRENIQRNAIAPPAGKNG